MSSVSWLCPHFYPSFGWLPVQVTSKYLLTSRARAPTSQRCCCSICCWTMGILGEHQESQGQEGGGLGPFVSGYSPAGKDMFPQLATLTLRGRVSCSLSPRSPCPSSWPPHIGPDISLPPILHWQHRGSFGSFPHWQRTEVSGKPSLVPSIEEQEPRGYSQNRTHRDLLRPTVST